MLCASRRRQRVVGCWGRGANRLHKISCAATTLCGTNMDVLHAVRAYTTKMVSSPSAIKVLLLDAHTTPIISLASTQSDLLTHQVYLTDRIDNARRDRMPHMKCICFLSPNEESLEAVKREIGEPKYGEYYLCKLLIISRFLIPSIQGLLFIADVLHEERLQ